MGDGESDRLGGVDAARKLSLEVSNVRNAVPSSGVGRLLHHTKEKDAPDEDAR